MTRVLMVAVALLGALYLLLLAGFGRGVPGVGAGEIEPIPALQLSEAQVELPGLDVFDDIVNRPLFADDRRPHAKETAQEPEAPVEAPPAVALNVALTGIIHTPGTRVVLVRDNMTGRSLNLTENMPLPGEQGAWIVKSIEPRRVVFQESGSDNETVLELAIGAAPSNPAPAPRAAAAPAASNARGAPPQPSAGTPQTADAEDEVARRAAEIRRRIEERRAQLRREAESQKR
ncbi:hypothetical protein B1808_13450 [Pseudofulvimonas gallinarii]|nr:hypothetical protein B1808_13450 [Pseudofulvimonas gallinarii]